jgi:hypothetical protein
MKTPSNRNNDSINRRANARAPAPVDVTKRYNTRKTEINKKNEKRVCVFFCVCVR